MEIERKPVAEVIEIRKLAATGNYSQPRLAKMFGITQGPINQIITRKTWSHVGSEVTA
jgi:hypothetical protein